jgi:phosphohistidine phosphatase
MKTIVFIRHAKSSWKHDLSDLKRPLKSRGITDANLVSESFKSYKFYPDFVFSSPALRALTTCYIFLDKLDISYNILQISPIIYDFLGNETLNFIKSIDENLQNIMIFGHNHAFTAIVNLLGDRYIDNVPTSGLVKIKFEIDSWKEIDKGETELILFPKHLKD